MKLKSLYLMVLMFCMSTVIFAQEKYEQAVIVQGNNAKGYVLYISIEGQEIKEVQLEKGKKKYTPDNTAVLNEIAKMRNEGWEVWNTTESVNTNGATYYLRRKLK